jgi:hypothetical protein
MLTRILTALVGLISTATGIWAGFNFQPPAYADPGAVNACWLTFILMTVCGLVFIWASTWRLNRHG